MDDTARPRRRIVLCRGQYCNLDRRADKLLAQLEPLLAQLNGDSSPPLVKLTTANCLSMCGAGPNCVVYPEDAVYNHLTAQAVTALFEQLAAALRAEDAGMP